MVKIWIESFDRGVLKNGILIVGEIENVDVKKFGNGNVIDGWDGVFKNKKI